MKKCEKCGVDHEGKYGSGRFCSTKCSRGFSTKAKRKEINEKVSKSLKSKNTFVKIFKQCKNKNCNKTFIIKSKSHLNKTFCSVSCANKEKGWGNHNSVNWYEINKLSYKNGNNYVAGGTTKWYTYKNIKVQGTYELRACKILDNWKENGKIKDWEYTKDRFEYIGEDNLPHSYLLDFKIWKNDDNFYYLETKGYVKPNDKIKWKAVIDEGYKLEIWFLEDIKLNELKL